MALPRILIAVPLIVAGASIPGLSHVFVKAPAGTVGMNHEGFMSKEVRIHRGDTLTFVNNSHYMHIIGPGRDSRLATVDGDPMERRVLMAVNASYTTPSFNVPGTYYITCSMHSEMTIKVVVTA
jgi:plastocyanin